MEYKPDCSTIVQVQCVIFGKEKASQVEVNFTNSCIAYFLFIFGAHTRQCPLYRPVS